MTYRKDYNPPVNDIQKKIITAFEKVLGVEKIGVDEDFFGLGGDSLSAINVITELDMPNLLTTDIFNFRSAEALSERCIELMAVTRDEEVSNVRPLIGTQNFIRIYHETLGESTAYNVTGFYKLKKDVDLDKLKIIISKVMHSHQSFRTTIRKSENGAELVLGADIREPEIIDTTEEELKLIIDSLVIPYKLYNNLLYKCKIFRTDADSYLFIEMHHILTDGTSMQIVLKEIDDVYNGGTVEEDRYFKLIQNRVNYRESISYRTDMEYYRKKMPSAERSFMPQFDFLKSGSVPGISTINLKISENDLATVKVSYGLAPTDFFIMCYLVALSKITGNTKVGTAFTVNGRDSALS